MKCYKIVWKYGNEEYISCRTLESSYTKLYHIDRWTTADPGTIGICTFDILENVQVFIRTTSASSVGDIIFLAEGEGRKYSELICGYGNLAEFYKQRKIKRRTSGSIEPPRGTLFFERVKLLEEIKR